MTTSLPGDVFVKATEAIRAGDVDGWLARCHDDVVLEFPYAPAGRPRRVEGRRLPPSTCARSPRRSSSSA